jgi:Ca2+-binding RTX toxin-like protein
MPAVWTEQQIITNLLRGGSFWSGSTITFGFPTVAPSWATGTESTGFSAFSAAQKTAGTLAISLWDDLIAPNMVLTTSAPQITMQNGYAGSTGYYAYSYFPGNQGIGAGSFWVNNYYNSSQGTNDLVTPTIGKWGFLTYLHELGHAMGLSHPGNYNGGSPTYAVDAAYTHDSIEYSVMSYFDASNTGADWQAANGTFYYPQTLMIDDVAAIQQRYGADLTTRSGNTVYGFNSTLSGVSSGIFDFTQNAHPILTIWDGAGNDTLDLSGFTTASRIDIHSGVSTDCDGMTNNIWIAYNCNIENASGGSAADNITGNDLANILIGNGGNDIIGAAAGDDQIIGGTGSDTLTGGLGNDMFIFNATEISAGQADTITDFVHDAAGAGDTIRLVGVTASTVSVAMSGANAAVSYGNGAIVDTITALAAGTNAFYVNGYSSLANAQANILANGFVFVSDAMNQIAHTWSSYLQTFDGSSILDSQNTINDNGTRVFVDYDNAGSQAWTNITDNFDSSNRLLTRNTLNDDNSHNLVTYDALSAQTWSSTLDVYDNLNRLTNHNTYNDVGTSLYLTYDPLDAQHPNGIQSWTYKQANFDNLGHLTNDITFNRNGTSLYLTYDPADPQHATGLQAWASKQTNYDANSRLTNDITYNDNGSSLYLTYDAAGLQTWTSKQTNYDSNGHLTNDITYNDNGTSQYLTFDAVDAQHPTGSQAWNYHQSNYNNLGNLTNDITFNDNGTSVYLTYDPAYAGHANGDQVWQYEQANYDSLGNLTLHIRFMDDGSTVFL